MNRSILLIARRAAALSSRGSLSCNPIGSQAVRFFAGAESPGLPDSVKRMGKAAQVPNEYPGQVYAFNWALNADGVTPLKKSAFRITKPLDLKVAGLEQPKTSPLKVNSAAAKSSVREAGTDELSFDTFDEVSQRTKDLLSLSDHLYCPEGHVPGTRIGVRVISNSATLAPNLVAYLERAPRREPSPQTITAYVLEGTEEFFSGYAIEEIEDNDGEAKSVAAVVAVGTNPTIESVVAGIELSVEGLLADEEERAKKAAEEEAAE
eukprot:CAMPEP_0197460054 /NCGR_PEP_ID=MMETSP1175-20131217/53151_1 /TAXON_ID=1003142 /ORGANISM="Triceratium dubium, Strain CCMP147" /LENGTH=263 /DNA_ID=CAMNT_0042995077 /DNA_START=50 /DNA_END=841 /DNA_ORIENTATION=+